MEIWKAVGMNMDRVEFLSASGEAATAGATRRRGLGCALPASPAASRWVVACPGCAQHDAESRSARHGACSVLLCAPSRLACPAEAPAGAALRSPSARLWLVMPCGRAARPAEEINKRPDEYWTLVMDIARKNNLKRILRCTQVRLRPCALGAGRRLPWVQLGVAS